MLGPGLVRLMWGQVPSLYQTAYYWVVGGHSSSLTVAVVGPSATHGGGATQRRAGRRAQGGVYIATCAGIHAKCIHNHATLLTQQILHMLIRNASEDNLVDCFV